MDQETGRFSCFACGAWGYTAKARERWTEEQRRERERLQSSSSPGSRTKLKAKPVPLIKLPKPIKPARGDIASLLKRYQDNLPGSWGEEYLKRRKIPYDLAEFFGVGYAPPDEWAHSSRDWRWGRLVVPHTTPMGEVVNLYGRAVGSDAKVPKHVRHDHLPGAKGYFNATVLSEGNGPVYVTEGAFDALSLLAAGCKRVIAIYGVHGWRWEWGKDVKQFIFALDADAAGEQWRVLARGARLRGKQVRVLEPGCYGGESDVAAAWVTGSLQVSISSDI